MVLIACELPKFGEGVKKQEIFKRISFPEQGFQKYLEFQRDP